MRETSRQLQQTAIQVANDFRQRVLGLQKQQLELQQRQREVEAHLDATRLSIQRFDSFEPEIGGELQCPECWIGRGLKASLAPQSSPAEFDVFSCRKCGREYSFEA